MVPLSKTRRPVAGSAGSRVGNLSRPSTPDKSPNRPSIGRFTPALRRASHLGRRVPGLDLEDEAVDGHHPDRSTGGNGPVAVGAGPPGGAPDGHDAVRVELGAGLPQLADH